VAGRLSLAGALTLRVEGVALVAGRATGRPLVLDEPLSFWGGVDAGTGTIIDTHHPQAGASIVDRVLVLPGGRGSSSSSSVLAEAIRNAVGPAAILLASGDPIIAIGCLVARELYGRSPPVAVLDQQAYRACVSAREVAIEADDNLAVLYVTQ
jgi:predicted aconitase with swiveling domain